MIGEASYLRAIGWLSDEHPFPVGDTPPEFLVRLKEFCHNWRKGSLRWPLFFGPHECELCCNYMASGNIGVPSGDVLFAAPEMVAHYVEAHRYSPPPEFIAAVLAAPLPGTQEYDDAVSVFPVVKSSLPRRTVRTRG